MTYRKGRKVCTLAEADPAGPGAMPQRRLIRLHAAGPKVPRDAMLSPVCVPGVPGRLYEMLRKLTTKRI